MRQHYAQIFHSSVLWFGLAAWMLLSAAQTVHFYTYYEQTLWDSIRWSFRDWFVWVVIFASIYRIALAQPGLLEINGTTTMLVVGIALLSGLLQVLTIVSIDFVQGTATRPFWEDFLHFYQKRWLLYLFIFSVFWLLLLIRLAPQGGVPEEQSIASLSPVKFNDGKTVHWVELDSITQLESAGNYVCVHHDDGQIIVRETLKALVERINSSDLLQVGRSHAVNLGRVSQCRRITGKGLVVALDTGAAVPIGPSFKSEVSKKLQL